jgi:hypothetical protein
VARIETSIRFTALRDHRNGNATVEFDFSDDKEGQSANWAIRLRYDSNVSADDCIANARDRVLENMRFLVRLADAD